MESTTGGTQGANDVYLIGHDDWAASTPANRVVQKSIIQAGALASAMFGTLMHYRVLVLGAWGASYLAHTQEVRELLMYGRTCDPQFGLPAMLYGCPIIRDYALDDSTFCRLSFARVNVWIDMKGAPC